MSEQSDMNKTILTWLQEQNTENLKTIQLIDNPIKRNLIPLLGDGDKQMSTSLLNSFYSPAATLILNMVKDRPIEHLELKMQPRPHIVFDLPNVRYDVNPENNALNVRMLMHNHQQLLPYQAATNDDWRALVQPMELMAQKASN